MHFDDIKKEWPVGEVNIGDTEYPNELSKIKKAPSKLFYRGTWNKAYFDKTAAVVGSRKITKYGREVAEKLTAELVRRGVTVISGFMYGTDTLAHQTAINYGGITIAVLGGGLDELYPPENLELYKNILETGGLIITEYENNFKPKLWSFPQRNRIVAGLTTRGVYIIEAGMKSGSLITARLAYQQKKTVYAIPGQITSAQSSGTNWLIEQGQAVILTSINKELQSIQENLFEEDLKKEEKVIIGILKLEAKSADEVSKIINMAVSEVLIILAKLELRGLIREEGGMFELAG